MNPANLLFPKTASAQCAARSRTRGPSALAASAPGLTSLGLLAACALLAACSGSADAPVAPKPTAAAQSANVPSAPGSADAHGTSAIAWHYSTDALSVGNAFTQAHSENKPLFLYWGATWCPPCNQVKATIFSRPDFIAQARSFVPVYLDGDTPSAQQHGKRFRVSGYPTMILFRPDGTEITRLAGEVEPAQYMQLLAIGLDGGASAGSALKSALSGGALTARDWRLLAYYSWDTDEQALVPKNAAAATLRDLAARCPADYPESAARLQLKAIVAASAAGRDEQPGIERTQARKTLAALLAQPGIARAHADIFTEQADDLVQYVSPPKSAERAQLVRQFDQLLDSLAADKTLSNNDRVEAVLAKVELARLDNPNGALPATSVTQARAEANRAASETSGASERQSVISSAGYLLREAGLLDESDALYRAELARSPAPYYFMSGLASNARKRGDKAKAIGWAQQAYDAAKGPATRLQWGAGLVGYLVDFAAEDEARIDATASRLLAELGDRQDAYSGRNRNVLKRMSERLVTWNGQAKGRHDALLARLHAQLAPACAAVPEGDPDRAACSELFSAQRG